MLTGLLYCGQHPEDGEWSRHYLCANFGAFNKDGRQQSWYICSLDYEAHQQRSACFHTRQYVLDEAVAGHVLQRVSLVDLAKEVTEQLQTDSKSLQAEARQNRLQRRQLQAEIERLKKRLPWADTKTDFDLLMSEIRQREAQIEQLSQPKTQRTDLLTAAQVQDVSAFLATLSKQWDRVRHETKRWFLQVLLERITIYHGRGQELYLHVRWRTGLTDILRVYRLHPPRPQGWRWDEWEDEAIRTYYSECQHVSDVLSRVKPFRNWWGVKQRAGQLGIRRTAARPPEGVAEHSQYGYKKKGVERQCPEFLGSYTEADRLGWVAEGKGPEWPHQQAINNSGVAASSRTGIPTLVADCVLNVNLVKALTEHLTSGQ